jgi:hypothetical protein
MLPHVIPIQMALLIIFCKIDCLILFSIRKNNEHNIKIVSVELLGTEESEVDKGIYPSDHFALALQLEIN